MRPPTHRWHPFCLKHVLFLRVHRWMHLFSCGTEQLLEWVSSLVWRRKLANLLSLVYIVLISVGFLVFFFLFQTNSGWKYGVSLDENMKTHPLIRPFKTLAEKVIERISAASIWSSLICVLLKINFKYILLNVRQRHKLEFLQLRIGTSLCWSGFSVNLTLSLV